jgi:hypothetical protein
MSFSRWTLLYGIPFKLQFVFKTPAWHCKTDSEHKNYDNKATKNDG